MERFWSKVDKRSPDECWEWTASRGSCGYGQSWWAPAKRAVGTHRIAYLLTHGSIPNGLQVAHTCHNKLCCNPAHLVAQSSADNNFANYKDKRHKSAKIKEWEVSFIWWLRLRGVGPSDICRAVGLSIGSVENVIYKRGRHFERVNG